MPVEVAPRDRVVGINGRGLKLAPRVPGPQRTPVLSQPVRPVAFRFDGRRVPDAKHVSLVSSFNRWNPSAHDMTRDHDAWSITVMLPAGAYLDRYRALAAPYRSKTKIADVQAMGLRTQTGNCLIRIITDAGLAGYGEAGSTGAMARARIETMKPLLIGKDPLAIEQHFQNMTSLMHTYMAHIPTISGIDLALWDLAGKIMGLPVCLLLGGPFRDYLKGLEL